MTHRQHSMLSPDHISPPIPEQDEARPTHTSEIGTLKKLPNEGTAWLGSSSGVYFVNTVRRAFSAAFATSNLGANDVPATEDILTGEDAEGRSYNGPVTDGTASTDELPQSLASALGHPPDQKIAIELVTSFFQAWHPLFPFLHGPTFLKDMDWIYRRSNDQPTSQKRKTNKRNESNQVLTSHELCKIVTFQLIINIASLDRTDIQLPVESRIKSIADVTRVAGSMALDHNLWTIQTLLAANLYLVATLAIRQASTIAGIIVKLIYHAGLHRCPLRYSQLSMEDCEIRKRVFWTAYALDRHCSLSLGDPNTIHDDDIDVCLSGKELHKAVKRDLVTDPGQEIALHMRATNRLDESTLNFTEGNDNNISPDKTTIKQTSKSRERNKEVEKEEEEEEKQIREAALTAYVHWGRLTGRIMEIFHKSINHRFPKQEQILYLTSDIETWWNDLPGFLNGEDNNGVNSDRTTTNRDRESKYPPHMSSFFKILYHRLLLLLNRPRLSLDQSTPEFQHGLQVCIRASRNILSGLKSHKEHGQSMVLPGLLSTAWMSGLIIAFACQLGKYPKTRACSDIHACLSLLESMNLRWYTVKNCHKVLSLLLANVEGRRASTNGYLAVIKSEKPSQSPSAPSNGNNDDDNGSPRKKRRRRRQPSKDNTETISGEVKMTNDLSSAAATSPSYISPESPSATKQDMMMRQLSTWDSGEFDANQGFDNFNPSLWDQGQSTAGLGYNPGWGSAVYANPQDMAFAQSSMALPELPNSAEDPMFWGNMDYNVADIFGSATWENMTGPFAPNWDPSMGV